MEKQNLFIARIRSEMTKNMAPKATLFPKNCRPPETKQEWAWIFRLLKNKKKICIRIMHDNRKDISRGWAIVDIFSGVAKKLFFQNANSFTKSTLKQKHYSIKELIRKWQVAKSRRSLTSTLDAHWFTLTRKNIQWHFTSDYLHGAQPIMFLCQLDREVFQRKRVCFLSHFVNAIDNIKMYSIGNAAVAKPASSASCSNHMSLWNKGTNTKQRWDIRFLCCWSH